MTDILKILGGIIIALITFGMFAWLTGPWTFIPMIIVGVLAIWKVDSTVGWTTIAMAILSILANTAG